MSIGMVVQWGRAGPLGREVDDRWGCCGQYETAVAFWQLRVDERRVPITGYLCVPTSELIVLEFKTAEG